MRKKYAEKRAIFSPNIRYQKHRDPQNISCNAKNGQTFTIKIKSNAEFLTVKVQSTSPLLH